MIPSPPVTEKKNTPPKIVRGDHHARMSCKNIAKKPPSTSSNIELLGAKLQGQEVGTLLHFLFIGRRMTVLFFDISLQFAFYPRNILGTSSIMEQGYLSLHPASTYPAERLSHFQNLTTIPSLIMNVIPMQNATLTGSLPCQIFKC